MLQKFRAKFSATALALVAMLAVSPAFAATGDIGDTVVAAITATNPQITAVVGAMAAALVLIVAWKLIKKAFTGG